MDPWDILEPVDVLAKLPADYIEQLESKKWTERRDVLQNFLDVCKANPRFDQKANYGEIVTQLKRVLEKDANINVASLSAQCLCAIAAGLRKKFSPFVATVTPVIFEKFKEKKPLLRDPLMKCIDEVARWATSFESMTEDIQAALDKPNPNIKIQTDMFLYRMFMTLNAQTMPKKTMKALAPSIVKHTFDPDADVREAAYAALGAAMKAIGEKAFAMVCSDVATDKLKMTKITEFCDKAKTEYAELEAQRKLDCPSQPIGDSDVAAAVETGGTGTVAVKEPEMDPWDMLEPTDVLSKLSADYAEQLESKKWTERRDVLQGFLDLCKANPRLDPKANYGDIISQLKKVLEKDANINVASLSAQCLCAIAAGLRKKFAPFVATVTPVIFEKFKEKKPLLRDPLMKCIDEVARWATSFESMTEDIQAALDKPNPSIKIQTDLFLYRVFKAFNAQSMPKKMLKTLTPSIIKHTHDSDPEVRDAAYAALGAAMKAIGEKAFAMVCSEIIEDKLKMAKINEFRDKAVQETGIDVVSVMVQSVHKSNGVVVNGDIGVKTETDDSAVSADTQKQCPLKPPVGTKRKSMAIRSERAENLANDESLPAANSSSARTRPPRPSSVSRANNVGIKKEPDENMDGALIPLNEKSRRMQEETKLKILKWNFSVPDPEHIDQLRTQLAVVCKPGLHSQLFHTDFKQHLKAIDAMQATLTSCPEAMLFSSDLVMKWVTLRFFDTNPSVLLKCLELMTGLLQLFNNSDEVLTDFEVQSFVPYLLLKTGEQKDAVRNQVRSIIDAICQNYSASKTFPLILHAVDTKNSRQRAECLEQLAQLIQSVGITVCHTPNAQLKTIAACIGDRDATVRNGALNAIVAAWQHVGDKVYQMIGKLNEKDTTLLDERIKRTRAKPMSAVRPAPAEVRPERSAPLSAREPARSHSPASRPSTTAAAKTRQSTAQFKIDHSKLDVDEPSSSYPGDCVLADTRAVDDELANPAVPIISLKQRPLSPTKRSVSMTSISSLDASALVDQTLCQMTNSDPAFASQAFVQLEDLLKESEKNGMLLGKMDQLLLAVYAQLRVIHNKHLAAVTVDPRAVHLYRAVCSLLVTICKYGPELIKEASEHSLKDLIQQLLLAIRDDRLKNLSEGSQVVRSINVVTVKLVEGSEPTACFLALCRLLRETMCDGTANSPLVELVMKCMWKQARLIPQLADRMKLDRVLAEAHQFFVQFPIDSSNRDALDMPLRTVKTVLNSIVQTVGDKILPYLPSIEKNGRSDAAEYVRRVLREVQRKQNQLPGQTEVLNDVANRMNNGSARSLADIFKVVSNKDTAEIGISQLHEWMMANPNGQSQMDQYLKSSTPFLRSFVEQGLSKRNETGIPHPSTVREGSQSAAALTRLHALRSQAGLADEQPRYNNIPAVPRAAFSLTSVVPSTAGSETRTRMPPEALADLKSRLDAVKRRSHMPSS